VGSTYDLDRSGPLQGDVVQLDWILIGDNLFVTDVLVSDLMCFDLRTNPYLLYAFERESIKPLEGGEFNRDSRDFNKDRSF